MDKKVKVLLVDDNEIIRMLFSNIFWLHGLDDQYELATVSRIEDARTQIDDPNTRPDIIFTGLVMPFEKGGKVSPSAEAGFSLISYIKQNPALSHIRVIVFSGYSDDALKEKSLALGAEQYLRKDENIPQDIINIIRAAH